MYLEKWGTCNCTIHSMLSFLYLFFVLDQNAFIGGWLREVGSRMGVVVYLEPTKGGRERGGMGGGMAYLSIYLYVSIYSIYLCIYVCMCFTFVEVDNCILDRGEAAWYPCLSPSPREKGKGEEGR